MFQIPSVVRRPLAVAGAAFVGLAATVALASPASAHHSEVTGVAECNQKTGEYDVKWSFDVDAPKDAPQYKFYEVVAKKWVGETVETVTVPGVEVTEGNTFPHASDTPWETETYSVPGDTTKLRLEVKAEWSNGFKEGGDERSRATIKLDGNCEAPKKPSVTAAPSCDYLTLTLTNVEGAKEDATFEVTGAEGYKKTVVVGTDGKAATLEVPAKNATKVTVVSEKLDYSDEFTWEDPGNCGEPQGSYLVTCDSITFNLTNPKDGVEVKVTFTPNTDEAPVERTVKPGEEMEPVTFKASAGTEVTISSEGVEPEVIKYDDEKPEDCGGGGGGELPKTGAPAGLIAGGAGGALAIGAALFFIARRRKLRFTA